MPELSLPYDSADSIENISPEMKDQLGEGFETENTYIIGVPFSKFSCTNR
jgi:hypothetical protein